ncbi:AMP-binding protein [Nocardioides zeae]|uniref:AMP-binding protein n=1 Tax=Nocardioides imazamoxiresistens TaxID=3231893 RepID=A0ABU3PS86_9ACTN|nr:AMP-binding protein [Nocardioides zeae]MDT9591645.1 AMP-binding protein [Nocardioides zeae]
MDILTAVTHWAQRRPDTPAVRDDDGELTWRELERAALREAAVLAGRGVAPGDRVGVVMANSRAFCVGVLATLAAGGVVVPLNHRLHPREMSDQLVDAGARLLLHDEAYASAAADAAVGPGAQLHRVTADGDAAGAEGGAEEGSLRVVRELDDVAAILYSSGTTGRPRGAAVTHRSIFAMAHDRIVNDAWGRHTVTYVPYPLAFSAGLLASWFATTVAGGLLVTDAAFDPGRALRRFEEDRITVFMAVPAVWQAIAVHPDIERTDVSSLDTVSAGGAMVTPELMATLRARGIRLSQGYGLTESSGVATALAPADVERKEGSVGRPMMLTESRIVAPDGSDCAVGEPGELWLRGPAVMAGYWKDGAPDPDSLVDGWLRTGDVATKDDEGYLAIVDRLKDMIITGGINVVPAEVERALEALPGVRECAVVGAPHERWGETPHAFVVADDPALTPVTISAALRERLAGFKIPTRIDVRTEPLPRSANGKVLRRRLRDEVSAPAPGPSVPSAASAVADVTALVERYFAAVNARDWEALRATLHPDVRIRQGDLLHADGVERVTRLYQAIVAQWDEHEDRPTRILVDGDRAAVEITFTGRRPDGTPVTFPAMDVITVRDGRVLHVSTWYDTEVVVPLVTGRVPDAVSS